MQAPKSSIKVFLTHLDNKVPTNPFFVATARRPDPTKAHVPTAVIGLASLEQKIEELAKLVLKRGSS